MRPGMRIALAVSIAGVPVGTGGEVIECPTSLLNGHDVLVELDNGRRWCMYLHEIDAETVRKTA